MTLQSPPQQKSAQHHTRSGTWLYPLARRIHFYAGILIAPFILVAALSGALYALAPQLEKVVYSQQLTAPISDHRISLDAQVKAAQSYLGKDTQPLEVRPGLAPGTTTRVMFADETLGESESRAVFIDPANGQVRGDLTVYGSSGSLPLRTWISQLHKNLHLGEVGRIYSELAASWLWLIAAFGLCMVIIKARRTKKLKGLAYPSNTARGYRTTLSWHTSAGVWLAVGLFFFSATGLTWSNYAGGNISDMRKAFGWQTPSVTKTLEAAPASSDAHADHGEHSSHGHSQQDRASAVSYDAVLALAQEVNVDSQQVIIKPAADEGATWIVQENQRSYPTMVDSVAVDAANQQVVDRADFKDFPVAAKLTRWGIDLHMGTLFGLVNQLILFFFGLGVSALCIWGYFMWWQRRPVGSALGKAQPRVAFRAVPLWAWVTLGLGSLLLGLALPVFGVSLLLMLGLDAALYLREKRAGASIG